jgi:hypothetical protein
MRFVPLFEVIIVSSAILLLVILNLSAVVNLTIDLPLLYFAMNAVGLIILSLLPHAMLRDGASELVEIIQHVRGYLFGSKTPIQFGEVALDRLGIFQVRVLGEPS